MSQKTIGDVRAIIERVHFMDRAFRIEPMGDGFFLQVQYVEADVETGKLERQSARKWYVSSWATETEIVETAFKACRVSMDHVLKEHFTYKGRRVYSPHFDIRARMELCDDKRFDSRQPAPTKCTACNGTGMGDYPFPCDRCNGSGKAS